MSHAFEIETPRLKLRQWRDSDREPFAALNAEPAVMEFFPALQDRAMSDASIDGWRGQIGSCGWGNWAVETREGGQFIGFIGLTVPKRALPFSPCVEVGWRLARTHWAHGYATEGARHALRAGFERFGLDEIVSFTAFTQSSLARGHGAHRHARCEERFRAPGGARGSSVAAALPVPDHGARWEASRDV